MNNRQQNIAAISLCVITMLVVALVSGCNQKDKGLVVDDAMVHISMHTVAWDDDITNPANEPYVLEVAFNLGIPVDSVTQAQFNERYLGEQ